jgi:hypothetical protein
VASIIRTGQLLNDCKAAAGHGEFSKILADDRLKIDERSAQRFMAIAKDQRLSNPTNLSLLPAVVDTLHRLTKLDNDTFAQANKGGIINPKMRARDVPKPRKESPQGDAVSAHGSSEMVPPLATVGHASPRDDSEGGDSVVTEHEGEGPDHNPHQTGVDGLVAEGSGKAGQERVTASTSELIPEPAAPWPTSAIPGKVAYYIDPKDPASVVANALSMLLSASREISPHDASVNYPEDMPLYSNDADEIAQYISEFAEEFRARYGNGNDAALAAE